MDCVWRARCSGSMCGSPISKARVYDIYFIVHRTIEKNKKVG